MGERKGTAQGALNSLGLRILNQSKIELSLSMRYLSRALDKLSFQMDFNTRRIGRRKFIFTLSLFFSFMWKVRRSCIASICIASCTVFSATCLRQRIRKRNCGIWQRTFMWNMFWILWIFRSSIVRPTLSGKIIFKNSKKK